MLLQIEEFRRRVAQDIDELVGELKTLTSRRTAAEEAAWRSSLPKVGGLTEQPKDLSQASRLPVMVLLYCWSRLGGLVKLEFSGSVCAYLH